ncbi:hypothetical protein B0T24DRAFT_606349 [Lasiosphaeria ovina]|uniref:Uncharacterized protein n=1 Tax=Lasiosphaeria ovina TaxID=92902 RepID=A0AAE0TY51_9PEZI|nr:hypothetical protein B0T24DRAFT_606349 [Lasiosphaeria ovina]
MPRGVVIILCIFYSVVHVLINCLRTWPADLYTLFPYNLCRPNPYIIRAVLDHLPKMSEAIAGERQNSRTNGTTMPIL